MFLSIFYINLKRTRSFVHGYVGLMTVKSPMMNRSKPVQIRMVQNFVKPNLNLKCQSTPFHILKTAPCHDSASKLHPKNKPKEQPYSTLFHAKV